MNGPTIQRGGQAIPSLDFTLGVYVAKTYIKNYAKFIEIINKEDSSYLKKIILEPYIKIIDHLPEYKCTIRDLLASDEILIKKYGEEIHKKACKFADKQTEEDTFQGMEAMVHNLCTMNSRSGAQTPFSSVNFGLCTTWEGRLISKCLMKAIDKGLGHGETALFPIAIFKMKTGVTDKGNINYDLFQQACAVSSRRSYPNFVNVDAPFNLPFYDPTKPNSHVAAMGAVAKGFIDLQIYNEEGKPIKTLKKYKIQEVKEYLLEHLELIDGKPEFIDFDDVTKYVNIKPGRLKISDSQTGYPEWVDIKKFMYWNDPKAKWLKISYTFNTSKVLGYTGEIIVTSDHPLHVRTTPGYGKWERIFAQDLKVGTELCPADPKGYGAKITKIEEVTSDNIITGYDFETESDCFNIDDVVSHNCRTRVLNNHFDPDHQITEGRGNLFWTTINLPYIALSVKEGLENVTYPDGYSREVLFKTFFGRLEKVMEEVYDYSMDRFNVVAQRRAKNYPFSMGQREYVGSEDLLPEDEIREVIKQGTISFGFIGLAETLVALIGKHHGESEEAQELGLKIIKFMKDKCDAWMQRDGMNYSVMASPAEGCTGRLLRCTRKKFGVIPGVTDKEYFTNSFHVEVNYPITAYKKIDIEAPYHALCLAGSISYVELSEEAAKNVPAFEQLVTYIASKGCGYFSINHPLLRDPICGYSGPFNPDGTCPRCGRHEFEGVPAGKLFELTTYTPDPEYDIRGKLEDVDKVFHPLPEVEE